MEEESGIGELKVEGDDGCTVGGDVCTRCKYISTELHVRTPIYSVKRKIINRMITFIERKG